jgi:hypothetical protein
MFQRDELNVSLTYFTFVVMLFSCCNCFREMNSLFSSTFSNQLLMSLLRLLQASDGDVRLLVLNTFQILVRRGLISSSGVQNLGD